MLTLLLAPPPSHCPRALTQAGLQSLAPLRNLRSLTWQSDDLASQGPVLEAFTQFTSLRSLALSCTRRTMELVFGPDYSAAFKEAMPYCDHLEFKA